MCELRLAHQIEDQEVWDPCGILEVRFDPQSLFSRLRFLKPAHLKTRSENPLEPVL